jgi:SAM-dependent methyltransferase
MTAVTEPLAAHAPVTLNASDPLKKACRSLDGISPGSVVPVLEEREIIGTVRRFDVFANSEIGDILGGLTGQVVSDVSPNDTMMTSSWTAYLLTGARAFACIRSSLELAGKRSIERVLDFGSGHGRVLRVLKAAFADASFVACDLDEDAVEFCASTFGATPVVSHENPDRIEIEGRFDLIWSGSVFTHVDAVCWPAFLTKLESLLAPSGILVFTAHGAPEVERLRDQNAVSATGLSQDERKTVLESYDRTGFGYAGYSFRSDFGTAVASPAWVRGRIAECSRLRLLKHAEHAWGGGQDVVTCVAD